MVKRDHIILGGHKCLLLANGGKLGKPWGESFIPPVLAEHCDSSQSCWTMDTLGNLFFAQVRSQCCMIRRKARNHLFLAPWYQGLDSTYLSGLPAATRVTLVFVLLKVASRSTEDKSGYLSSPLTCLPAQIKGEHRAWHKAMGRGMAQAEATEETHSKEAAPTESDLSEQVYHYPFPPWYASSWWPLTLTAWTRGVIGCRRMAAWLAGGWSATHSP